MSGWGQDGPSEAGPPGPARVAVEIAVGKGDLVVA
jgi:hypothetical protein